MNLIMIKYFQQWIKDYQQQLVPAHLSGLMRVGYWDNKVTRVVMRMMMMLMMMGMMMMRVGYWDNKVTRVMVDDDDDDDEGGLLGQQGDQGDG